MSIATFCRIPEIIYAYAHTQTTATMNMACLVDYLTIGCECCEFQYNLWFVNGEPPPPQHRPADQRGLLHKELMQCQFCFKSKMEGVTFFRCGACQIEIYCSKECQKKAWSRHKEKCAINRKYQPAGGGEPKPMKDLRAFTSKHRPSISSAAAAALGVKKNPQRSEEYVFAIFLRPRRKGAARIETAFWALGAAVVPMRVFPPDQLAEMRTQHKSARDLNVANGSKGAMAVVLMCIDPNVVNVVMMGFGDGPSPVESPGPKWKHWLLQRLNEGLVA
ncbi:hypothetical protein C8Q70DRAFT_640144 [Cubamyces menziesii]|nr:hypothetical protein C8Q70DRAFT_640144 [Cubamyces menziesii]